MANYKNSINDFRLPAEWEQQSGIQLTWPHANTDWKPYLEDITKVFVDMAKVITSEELLVVATPEIVSASQWGDLEKLNRERELVGIYLSAHPLDEYSVILENVCNVTMLELSNLTPLQGRDLVMGGIVTNVREGQTKTGKPYGIAKVEDYSGSYEFAFFGSEWIEKRNFFMVGMFLFLKGKCQPRQWKQDEWEVKVGNIELLPEVKDKLIDKITINAPLSSVDDEMITDLLSIVKEHPGRAELCFVVKDEDGEMHVSLSSKTIHIEVEKTVMSYIKSQPQLSFKIN